MKEAIKRAVEGGWNDKPYRTNSGSEGVWTHYDSFLLDRNFWQALGKTEGWDKLHEEQIRIIKRAGFVNKSKGKNVGILPTRLEGKLVSIYQDNAYVDVEELGRQVVLVSCIRLIGMDYIRWKIEMHNFTEKIIQEGDTEKFFTNLLKK